MKMNGPCNRVEQFLHHWTKPGTSRDPQSIYGLNPGDPESEAELRVDDLRQLVQLCRLTSLVLISQGAGTHDGSVKWRQPGFHKDIVTLAKSMGLLPEPESATVSVAQIAYETAYSNHRE